MSSVGVIGAGTMGTGVAYVFAAAGYDAVIAEPDGAQRERALRRVATQADKAVARGKLSEDAAAAMLSRVEVVRGIDELPEGLDLLVEAVPERVGLKHSVLAAAESRRPRLLASNTSGLCIGDLACRLTDPARFLGMHFFNPVWSMRLLELVRGEATSDEAVAAAQEMGRAIGKEMILVRDSPGFATSRLGIAIGLEAMRMFEDGVASAVDIDRAMELGYGHPMGPLRLTDHVGLDVRLDIARHLETSLGPRFTPPRILEDKVAAGETGRKAGKGFYEWGAGD